MNDWKTNVFTWVPQTGQVMIQIGLCKFILRGHDIFKIELTTDESTLREFARAVRLWADSISGVDL